MSKQTVTDPSKGKYFSQILHMADDDLGPYPMRLLVHYTRVAGKSGKCWEGIRTTARITQMSLGMITKTRNQLEELGYIKVKHRDDDTCVIVIVDRWAENIARYAHETVADEADEFDAPSGKRSRGEQGVHTAIQGVHVVNTSEGVGVHVVNERIQQPKEVQPKKNKKDIASDDAMAFVPSQDREWTVADEADEYQSLPVGKKQKAARAEKAETRMAKTTATTPPPPTPSPAPRKSSMSRVIDDAWTGSESTPDSPVGVSKIILPQLMGTAKAKGRKEHNLTPPATECEVFAFRRYYLAQNGKDTPMPVNGEKIEYWFLMFRSAPDYAKRVQDAQYYVSKMYHGQTVTPAAVNETEYIPADSAIFAQLDDILSQYEDHS